MNYRVGLYYFSGGLILCVIAGALMPVGLVLLWPGTSLLVVSSGYWGLGPRIFAKRHGGHPLWVRVFFLFVFCGHELSRRFYARQCRPWDELVPGLLIGRQLTNTEAEAIRKEGVTAVIDLTAEFSAPPALRKLNLLSLPILDLTPPSASQLDQAVAFLTAQMESGRVYVHCKIGYSRTAAVTGVFLIRSGRATGAAEAIRMLETARPSIIIRPEARQTIERA